MARPGEPRVTPDVPRSPTPASDPASRDRPRLQQALGGGRRRGADGPVPAVPVARELWLAVHLPHYVLESLGVRATTADAAAIPGDAGPVVVVDLERGGKVVCDCDALAAATGIVPGMALNSALALEPGLRVRPRDPRRERALLDAVAAAAQEFTPRVSLEPPDGVLLEVRGSLRLFGGARSLCERLRDRLRAHGLDPRLALTPTPLASLWFTRAGEEVALGRPDALPARIAPLPLAVTRWPARTLQALATMGVRAVGDCLRLPRDASRAASSRDCASNSTARSAGRPTRARPSSRPSAASCAVTSSRARRHRAAGAGARAAARGTVRVPPGTGFGHRVARVAAPSG